MGEEKGEKPQKKNGQTEGLEATRGGVRKSNVAEKDWRKPTDQKHQTNVGKPNERMEKLRRNLKTQGWWWYTRTPAQPHLVTPAFLFLPPLFFLLPLPFFFTPSSHLCLSLFPFHSFSLFQHFCTFFHTFSTFRVFPHLFHPPCLSLFTSLRFVFHSFSPFSTLLNHYSLSVVFCLASAAFCCLSALRSFCDS